LNPQVLFKQQQLLKQPLIQLFVQLKFKQLFI
jgi:hypothetical protein